MSRIATDILGELQRRGVRLEATGGRLRFAPKEAVTPDLLEALKQHKGAIIEELTGDNVLNHCPGPEKCKGCYRVSDGRQLHPPKCAQDWFDRLARWQPGNGRLQ